MANLIWLALIGGLAFMTQKRGWAEGDGPFDQKPDGVAASTVGPPETIYAASGKQYKITSYARGAEQKYHVAEQVGSKAWISFITDDKTGVRVLFRAHGGDSTALANIRKDFAL